MSAATARPSWAQERTGPQLPGMHGEVGRAGPETESANISICTEGLRRLPSSLLTALDVEKNTGISK